MGKVFDFAWTCPDINKQIEKIQSELIELAEEIIVDVSPYVDGNSLLKLKQQWGASMYERIEQYIEGVRSTNSDMRDQAEKQMEDMKDEIDTLKKDNRDFERQIDDMQRHIEDLEYAKNELQKDLDEANARLETTGYFD